MKVIIDASYIHENNANCALRSTRKIKTKLLVDALRNIHNDPEIMLVSMAPSRSATESFCRELGVEPILLDMLYVTRHGQCSATALVCDLIINEIPADEDVLVISDDLCLMQMFPNVTNVALVSGGFKSPDTERFINLETYIGEENG